ncbi:MAG: Gldg family protein [Eubacterium sp.]
MKGIKSSFKNRKFRMGGYQTLIMVIVIILVIGLNLVVNKMNITVDLSSQKIYTLTEDTTNLVREIKDKVTLYYMCQDGSEVAQIEKVVDNYDGLGTLKVVKKDPVIYPNFSKSYTDEDINSNDVIVVNETNGKSKLVKKSDMLLQDMNYQMMSQSNTLDAEGQLTAAIQTVTSENATTLYYTTGHNEQELEATFKDVLNKSNIATKELATESAESVPDDCNILLINGPQYDFTEAEYNLLSGYLKEGGKAMFFLYPTTTEKMTNYYKLLSDYGVNVADGYIIDEKGSYTPQYPMYLTPMLEDSELTKDLADTQKVVIPICKGMTVQSDVRSTLTVGNMMSTTEEAYAKTNIKSQTTEKEDGDISGPFSVALSIKDSYAEKTKGAGHATEIVVFGSVSFETSTFLETNQFGNRTVLLNSLSYLSGEETTTLAIPTRNLDEEIVQIQESDRIFFVVLLVVIIPLILLGTGLFIWIKRRKN